VTFADRFIVGNSVNHSTLADYIICLSNDIGCLPPETNITNLSEITVPSTVFLLDSPYSVVPDAHTTGLDLHTKRRLQLPDIWDSGVSLIQQHLSSATDFLGNPLEDSTFKFLLQDKISWGLAQAILPGSKMYLPMFPGRTYLDLIPKVISKYDLAPVNENMSVAVFDAEVNRNIVKDYNIIYFDQTDNYVMHLADIIKQRQKVHGLTVEQIYDGIYQAPWFVVKQMLSDTKVNVYKLIDRNYLSTFDQLRDDIEFYTNKVAEQIKKFKDNSDIVTFDLGMVYTMNLQAGIDCYTSTCEKLGIQPNVQQFVNLRESIRSNRQDSTGSLPIPDQYADIFTGIAQVVLNRNNVYADTALRDIGWNLCCDIATKVAFADQGLVIPDNINPITIQDIIKAATKI
jgi:hypothetical protein